MLRCPPSRISLTPADIAGLNHRLSARQAARSKHSTTSNVRFSRGPHRSTKRSIVSAEDNTRGRRAASSSSEATFHDGSEASLHDDRTPTGPHMPDSDLASSLVDRHALSRNLAIEAENAVSSQQAPTHSTTCINSTDSLEAALCSAGKSSANIPLRPSLAQTDGSLETHTVHEFASAAPPMPFTRRGNAVLGELRSDAFPISGRRSPEPHHADHPMLASARARRQHGDRSRHRVLADSAEVRSIHRLDQHNAISTHNVPALRVSAAATLLPAIPTLDPGAPVFVPRTRYAIPTSSENEPALLSDPHTSALDHTSTHTNLRVRSMAAQNRQPGDRRPALTTAPITEDQSHTGIGGSRSTNRHYHGRSLDQGMLFAPPTISAASYDSSHPLDASNSRAPSSRQWSASRSHSSSSPFHPSIPPQAPTVMQRVSFETGSDRATLRTSPHPASSAMSLASQSTPNLLSSNRLLFQSRSRYSSSSWIHPDSGAYRASSTFSATSGTGTEPVSRRSSWQELQIAEDFIRRRSSPLDELTKSFSRMRSVGRSWPRSPSNWSRPSLLSGDPFGQRAASRVGSYHRPAEARTRPLSFRDSGAGQEPAILETVDNDVVALALALPPSSPISSGPAVLPNASAPLPQGTSSSSILIQRSPIQGTPSCKSPRDLSAAPQPTMTPRFSVYDDSRSQYTQPQTPADVTGARRAAHNSVVGNNASPILVGRAIIDHLPAISATYDLRDHPSMTSTTSTAARAGIRFDGRAGRPEQAGRPRTRRHNRTQQSSGQIENELEGHLQGLEADRRVWLQRREGGSLDITPPREGRFERYLS